MGVKGGERLKVKVIYGDDEKVIEVDETKEIWKEVITKAISPKVFNLPPPPVNYQVFCPRVTTTYLSPHKTLKDYDVPEGAILVMAHVHVVGDC